MSRRDFVVYGAVPWREPWLFDHNLADALSRRGRVLYVEPPMTPLTPLRHLSRPRMAAELAAMRERRPRGVSGMHAFRPLALPPLEHPRAQAMSAPLIRRQIRHAVEAVGIEEPVAVASMRSILDLRGAAGERSLVYCVTDWAEAGADLLGLDSAKLARDTAGMCEVADLVCTSSPQLTGALSERGIASTTLPHGFHSDLASRYDAAAPPAEYASLPRPLLGYAGTIDGRLDFDALGKLADRNPDGSVVLIGPVSPRLDRKPLERLGARANVHLLGLRSRDELPAYLRWLDCSLIPYRADEWGRYGLPLKLWDYLYAGPPIVGSGYVSLREYPPPLVRYAEGSEELCSQVAAALADGAAGREERRAFALVNSWDARAEALERMLSA